MKSEIRRLLLSRPANKFCRLAARLLPTKARATLEHALPWIDPFDIALPNGRIVHWQPERDFVTKPIKFGGWDGYETHTIRIFYRLAETSDLTIDVGANVGYFSAVAAAARAGNRVVAFEPMPLIAAKCRRLASRNPELKIEVAEVALGKENGLGQMFSDDPRDGAQASLSPAAAASQSFAIRLSRLSDWLTERKEPAPDLIKIDTESTEPDVLAGMSGHAMSRRPAIILEVLPIARVALLARFLHDNDYGCVALTDSGPERRESPEPAPDGAPLNYLFYPLENGGPTAALARKIANEAPPEGNRHP